MSKGISLEQFRNELEGDAQRRCLNQEKTIKELQTEIKEKDKLIQRLENRCFLTTRGTLCIFCFMKKDCTARNE